MILDKLYTNRKVEAINLQNRSDKKKTSSQLRSLYKTISWRIVGTIDTMAIAYILTGKFDIAFSIGGIEVVSKMILYYFHERVWENRD